MVESRAGAGQCGPAKRMGPAHLSTREAPLPPPVRGWCCLILLRPEARGRGSGVEICAPVAESGDAGTSGIWSGWNLGGGQAQWGSATLKIEVQNGADFKSSFNPF